MNTTLWHFRYSHFAEKVRWTLDHKAVPHLRRALIPGWHIPTMMWVSGQRQIPVLELAGRKVVDSSAIIAAIEASQPSAPLYPEDADARRRALAIEEWFDEHIGAHIRRLWYACYLGDAQRCARMNTAGFSEGTARMYRGTLPLLGRIIRLDMGIDDATVDRSVAAIALAFDELEQRLHGRDYMVDERFTVADLTAAALLSPIVRPPEFPYALPDPLPPRLAAIRSEVAERDGFRWVEEMYRRHRGSSSEL